MANRWLRAGALSEDPCESELIMPEFWRNLCCVGSSVAFGHNLYDGLVVLIKLAFGIA